MICPEAWECRLWEQILPCLIEGRKTASSYYVLAVEMVRRCRCEVSRGA